MLENTINKLETESEYMDRIVGNPVHAFNLIRRFTIDIPNIEKDLRGDDWAGTSQQNLTIDRSLQAIESDYVS